MIVLAVSAMLGAIVYCGILLLMVLHR